MQLKDDSVTKLVLARLQAMSYSDSQRRDLGETIGAIDCDTIIVASPVDLAHLIPPPKPYCRVRYDLDEMSRPVAELILEFLRSVGGKPRP